MAKKRLNKTHRDMLKRLARTFEDVLEVWSEAEELRTSICGTTTALATINNDVIVRIKKDVEKRNKGA